MLQVRSLRYRTETSTWRNRRRICMRQDRQKTIGTPQKHATVDATFTDHSNLRRASYVVFATAFAPLIGRPVKGPPTEATENTGRRSWPSWRPGFRPLSTSLGRKSSLLTCLLSAKHRLPVYGLRPHYPHVQAWAARVLEIPAVAERHHTLNDFKAVLATKKQETEKTAAKLRSEFRSWLRTKAALSSLPTAFCLKTLISTLGQIERLTW